MLKYPMKTIDENFLNLGADENEEISENQLKLLDLDLDKKNTWKNEVIKKNISDARAELFILLSGISSKTNQNNFDKWIMTVATNRLTGHSKGFFSVYTMPPNQAVTAKGQIKINEKRKQIPEYRDVKNLF